MSAINLFEYIESHTLRLEASHRGGGIEIDVADYIGIENAKMTAYQNYLGGGMLGSIQSDRNFNVLPTMDGWHDKSEKLRKMEAALPRYFYNITNEIVEDWDEWAASDSFEQQQNRPGSAY